MQFKLVLRERLNAILLLEASISLALQCDNQNLRVASENLSLMYYRNSLQRSQN